MSDSDSNDSKAMVTTTSNLLSNDSNVVTFSLGISSSNPPEFTYNSDKSLLNQFIDYKKRYDWFYSNNGSGNVMIGLCVEVTVDSKNNIIIGNYCAAKGSNNIVVGNNQVVEGNSNVIFMNSKELVYHEGNNKTIL